MSASLLASPRTFGGIIHDTMKNSPRAVPMKGIDRLVSNTTGIAMGRPAMDGVLKETVPADRKSVPELQPVHAKDKTSSKMAVGIPYAGDKSGYGQKNKTKKGGK